MQLCNSEHPYSPFATAHENEPVFTLNKTTHGTDHARTVTAAALVDSVSKKQELLRARAAVGSGAEETSYVIACDVSDGPSEAGLTATSEEVLNAGAHTAWILAARLEALVDISWTCNVHVQWR